MNIPLKNQSIADKYANGPENTIDVQDVPIPQGQNVQMTPDQINTFLDETLPLMRKQGEYDRLMIEQLTNDALLNRRPTNTIPGLLGMELKVREINAQQALAEHASGLSNMISEQKQKEIQYKQLSIQSGISQSLVYDGMNAGQILAFAKGLPIETAEVLNIDEASNPEKRITFTLTDSSYKSGVKSFELLPTNSIVRFKDNSVWILTADEMKS